MKNYVLMFMGMGGMAPTQAEMQAQMADWSAWYGMLGAAFAYVDGGLPISPASKVIDGQGHVTDGAPGGASGYAIIRADSMDSAVKLAKGCPVLKLNISVHVLETMAM